MISLTDHHEGVLCWDVACEIRRRIDEGSAIDLWILPGMELTAKDSAQAIVLFDADLPRNLFEKARARLGLPADCKDEEPRGIQVELLDHNLEELQGILNQDDELSGRFIILPNVTPGGHKTVLREGFHRRFKEMPYVGGYLDKQYPHELKVGDLRILNGEIPAWTSDRRGVIATSDSRHADYRALGEYSTWTKMAEPTAESLRQAMLAADSRILYQEFIPPAVFIESVTVSDAAYLNLGHVELSSQFNALIGGRGAGKSTLLEFVRFGLGCSALDFDEANWDPTFERRKEILLQALGPQGRIEIAILINGARIRLARARDNLDQIRWNVDGTDRIVSAADVREQIPMQTFSQGELSLLGQVAAEQRLWQLVTDPARAEFDELRDALITTSNELGGVMQQLMTMWTLQQEQRRTETANATLEAQVTALREQLVGGPAGAQSVVDDHQRFIAISSWFAELSDGTDVTIREIVAALAENQEGLQSLLRDGEAFEAPEVEPAVGTLRTFFDGLVSAVDAMSAGAKIAGAKFVEYRLAWAERRLAHDNDYQLALEALAGQRGIAETIAELAERLNAGQAEYDDLVRRQSELASALDRLIALQRRRSELHAARVALTEQQVARIAETSRGLATASVEKRGDMRAIHESIVSLFAGTGVREQRLTELLNAITVAPDPHNTWWAVMAEIMAILRWKTRGLRDAEKRPESPFLDAAIDSGGLEKFCERVTAEKILQGMKAEIAPRIRVTLKRGAGTVEFALASQGERAATLLTILMHQGGGPLLIDQPEEDLDNRIIGDIVAITRTAKATRQLMFATHNANLVVNGDAELVFDLTAGTIGCMGAIDSAELRDAITETMEGGRDAFELRRRKYNY